MKSAVQPTIQVSFVGAGGMIRAHAAAFRDIPGVSLAGITNRTRAKAETIAEEFGIQKVYNSVSEMFESTQSNLVVIAVLEPAIKEVATSCFRFPWVVLMEKPPGLNPEEAETLQRVAIENSRRVYVGLNRRFYSVTRAVLASLENDNGERFINVQDQQDLEALVDYKFPKTLLDNWMYANSLHLVDYFCLFGRGDIASVERLEPWRDGSTRIVAARIGFSSGDQGLYTCLWNRPGPWAVSISTPSNYFDFRPLERGAVRSRFERTFQPLVVSPWDLEFKAGIRLQAEHAVRALNSEPHNLPDLGTAIRSMQLVKAIYATT